MKRNKIAAGALALALGLGAVAPSFAADTKVSAEYTYDYKVKKNAFIEAWNALRAAEKALAKAEENEAAAKAKYDKALAAKAEFEVRYGKVSHMTSGTWKEEYDREMNDRAAQNDIYQELTHQQGLYVLDLTGKDVNKLGDYIIKTGTTIQEQQEQLQALKNIIAINEDIAKLNAEVAGIENKRADILAEVSRRRDEYDEAKNKKQEAKNAKDAAQAKYDTAKKELVDEGVNVDVINKAEKAGDITLIFENVKPAKPADKDEIKPETRAALEKAILDAKIQIKAVETLKKTTPKTIAKVVDKLDKLVKEAEATIKMSEELLGKKAAFNVVSTAYAADEEKSAEEKAKELTEKLNEKTKEIEDTLKENEANQPAEEEVKPEEKPEEKPADDKKDEEKPAEDKKEDKKEEKTTTTTKVVKKAGNNAKTGIAGVAGVAGVLAAASVAYAASKKNN